MSQKKIKTVMQSLVGFKEPENKKPFILTEDESERKDENSPFLNEEYYEKINSDIYENLNNIKKRFNFPKNSDLNIREFEIVIKNHVFSACIVFFDGMIDRKTVSDNILRPMMMFSRNNLNFEEKDIVNFIKNHILTYQDIKVVSNQDEVIKSVNSGMCAIFIDSIEVAFLADVKGFEHRNVEKPITEQVIMGALESFNEVLRVNTALIRKRLGDSQLIVEDITIGKRSKTLCSMLYIEDITNKSLVNEVRRRLQNIDIDYIFDTGELTQFLEEDALAFTPQILSTERPDKATSFLAEGRVVILMNGSPFALIAPTTNSQFIQSTEDTNLKFLFANFSRIIRMIAVFLTLLLPGMYVAIINYHQDLIPTSLLFAIAASRERVPFPSVIEILIMEISFELIREAGIRVPGAMGPTIGVVAALILGQASVAANIVSPILIVIVAITGIGSYAIPNYAYGFALRMQRFLYIAFGAVAGLFGISVMMFIHLTFMVDTKSFGVPFMAPISPKTHGCLRNEFFKNFLWKDERRADYLNAQKKNKQSKTSMPWKKTKL